MIHCPGCGAANSGHSEVCHSCHMPLNEDEAAVSVSFEAETSRFDEFASQVEAYSSGSLSREEFGQWVQGMRDLLARRRENYVRIIKESELEDVDLSQVKTLECLEKLKVSHTDYFEEREQEVSTAMEGMMEFESALQVMLEFANDENLDDSTLLTALQQLWRGNQKCNEAIYQNRVYHRKLLSESALT